MLIDFRQLFPKYGIKPKGVIQIGSHWAEEHSIYQDMGIERIVYIEPCEDSFHIMISKVVNACRGEVNSFKDDELRIVMCGQVKMIRVACGDKKGEMNMYVSHNNQGQSNSLLKPELHLQQHPDVVFTDTEKVQVRTLDSLPFYRDLHNILVIDVQGAEGLVLKGATETLKHIDCIYTECNRGQTYTGNMEIEEMDAFLKFHNFVRVETYWPSTNWTWGDCYFVRESLLK